MKISVDLSGARRALEKLSESFSQKVQESLDATVSDMEADAKSSGAFTDRTGNLRSNIVPKFEPYKGSVIANTPYAYYVENGNDPGGGRIYPKTSRYLRFEINGQLFFAKSVKAAVARPFMGPALERGVINLHNRLNNVITEVSKTHNA